MRAYRRVMTNALAVSLAYKWNTVISLSAKVTPLVISLVAWHAIFQTRAVIGGYGPAGMYSYLVATSLFQILFSTSSAFRLPRLIRTGELNPYLLRPYSFLLDDASTFVGGKIFDVVLVVGGWLVLSVTHVVTMAALSLPSLIFFCADLMLSFLFNAVVSTLGFWIIEMWPVQPLYNAVITIVGGVAFPLTLLPRQLFHIAMYTPFPYFGYANSMVLVHGFGGSWRYIAVSLSWSVLLFGAYHILWRAGAREYEGVNA